MNKTLLRGLAVTGASLLATAGYAPAVSAQNAPDAAEQKLQANLTAQNRSGASGTAMVTLKGDEVTVDIRATGLSPNLAHAQHIHVGGQAACPAPSADKDKDGFVSTKEGEPFIGPVKVSLTTKDDMGTRSATATDRFPKANDKGVLTYKRTFKLPSGVSAEDMKKASIELHGISTLFNNKSLYDGDKRSSVDNKLPFETTVPAACGVLSSTPAGAPDTGFGSTAGLESPAALAFGTVALASAVALFLYARRPVISSRN